MINIITYKLMDADGKLLIQFASQSFERLKDLDKQPVKNINDREYMEKCKDVYRSVISKVPSLVLKANREYPYLYYFYGVTMYYLNKDNDDKEFRENSIRLIKTAINISPANDALEYERQLIDILYNERKYTEASVYCEHYLKMFPKEKYHLKMIVELFQKLNRIDESFPYARKLIEVDPDDYESFFNLGKLYLSSRMYNDALTSFRRSKELDSKFPDNYKYMGIIYLISNKKNLAGSNFKTAIGKKIYNYEQFLKNKSAVPDAKDDERNTLLFLFEIYINLIKCGEDYWKDLQEVEKSLKSKSYLTSQQIDSFKRKNKISAVI
jgi:tetratricopeptide (TPR) repeat protein